MLKHKIKFRSNDIGLGQGFEYLSEIAFVFLPISVNLCFGCSGEALIGTVLLSTLNIGLF